MSYLTHLCYWVNYCFFLMSEWEDIPTECQIQQVYMNTSQPQPRSPMTAPLKGVLALWSEVVDVGFKVEFEDVVFVDVLRLRRDSDRVAQQREAGQRVVVLWAGGSEGQESLNYHLHASSVSSTITQISYQCFTVPCITRIYSRLI